MDDALADLVWRGMVDANPWWSTGRVPPQRTAAFRRHAFDMLYSSFSQAEQGRGVVVLGPRRVGKTVIVHQLVEQLLRSGVPADTICLLTLDDVALRGVDLGELLVLLEARKPHREARPRFLVLDEVLHSPDWAGWLKRIADRRDPYVFFATGSSATALRRGGQDAGVGRWRELTLFPWSLREHVQLRNIAAWTFEFWDTIQAGDDPASLGRAPPDETERLDAVLVDYLLRGGFPEAALADDLAEARRRLRQDILDRALGRDVLDEVPADPRGLERLFLRICRAPGGLWNEGEASRDLGISRPTVRRYVQILEQAFLVFRLPNLASPIKGQPKIYLVAPALRQALLGLDEEAVRRPESWGQLAENAVAAAVASSDAPATVGFWRKERDECDLVLTTGERTEYVEVKRSGAAAIRGIRCRRRAQAPRRRLRPRARSTDRAPDFAYRSVPDDLANARRRLAVRAQVGSRRHPPHGARLTFVSWRWPRMFASNRSPG